ncbi:PolC-type DNA polymerase III [Sporanaerobacter acetigenes]|uniref:DNA polymerase III PolC-type n=1 Tax=Sporanaerobacter acetigenes DSM 13106 TaxID=1123281 RepID=A0A1M5XJ25_9FIRM|nr:PolC-type DNA polymerase III [Sporanaerobacter acetigenes]SHH99875.1 DNA polymerase III catalytic subunit, PolC type [Sporanaerobacter acetigenes DSM 13106]
MVKETKLVDLLNKKEIRLDLSELQNVYIRDVFLDSNVRSLSLQLVSKFLVNEGELIKLQEVLKTKLPKFEDIEVNILYDIDEKDLNLIMNKYWANLVCFIEKEIPSSSGWIKNLEWKMEGTNFILICDSEVISYALKKNNIEKMISQKIKKELGINVVVTVSFVANSVDMDELLIKKIEEEEKELAQNIAIDENSNDIKDGKEAFNKNTNYIYGKNIEGDLTKLCNIDSNTGTAIVEGELFQIESREIKGGKILFTFNITDYTNSITVKAFIKKKDKEEFEFYIKEGVFAKIEGDVIYDNYSRSLAIILKNLNTIEKIGRKDNSADKRVELHLHTQMSAMDGITSFSRMAKRAKDWGHSAIAITDHGVVQSFPEGMEASKKYDLKVIYGLEGYLVNDIRSIVTNCKGRSLNTEYVVFDIETTGFSPINNKITEIGAVKIKNGEIIDRYSQLINPEVPIPEKIVDLTGITDELVRNKPTIDNILPGFYNFIEGSVLVAHNASFDVGFIRQNLSKLGIDIENPVLDTLELTRNLFPELKSHKLNIVAKHLNVSLENHHRAVDDAEATAHIFLKCKNILSEKGIKKLDEVNTKLANNKNGYKEETYHVIILVKNYIGLRNLYEIVSDAHLKYFYRKPRIPKSILVQHREGLIIGSACEAGELYKGLLKNRDYNEIREIVNFYDYLEIQPIGNNKHLIADGMVKNEEELRNINRKILSIGKKYNKPVVATGDVHFLDPEDEIYRRILMYGQGFKDADNQPPLYFMTTDEMLEEFSYLGEEEARKVVIDNTNYIANLCEKIIPVPDGTFPPVIEGSEEQLRQITNDRAIEIYGNPLPRIVKERLDKELNSIIKNGYAVLYIIAQKLVWKSLEDGYLVGSRGSVGSSFVATMSGITEVNPLVPHYICPNCKYSEFIEDGSIGSGVDLPDKNCPRCGTKLRKDGHDIPFEVFLGFEGDKEPDIDLNFAGEYQPVAHKYTEELFGKGYVFRAGTIGTIAEKTAYGFIKKYFDEKNISVHPAEINRLVKGLTGIKRTSGQHPGGVMIVPKYKNIHDFTPIQYPADDKKSGVITTHFDYHSISGRILKLDILGHDVPSIIRMLEDITGVDPQGIPLDDSETMKLFTSTEPLGVTSEDINSEVGTLGIPEFGTKFVRQMLMDTKPSTFAELVRISGLSHGTDVWLNNAQDLIKNGTAKLSNVISTRDDIMLFLIHEDLDKKRSFKIMEKVRKGKGLPEEDENYMRDKGIPEWYIGSCKKIKYMFPKAHAVAYVMMSYRIAYFKVHYPEAFYATYFTTKASDFDAELILKGKETVKSKIAELESASSDKTAKEKNLLTVLEVVLEMYCRGFKFEKVDLYKSDSDKFIIGEEGIIPPLKSLQGMGETAARNIIEQREKGKFISAEDLMNRTKVSKPVVEVLKNHGCLDDIPDTNQLSLFNI